MPTTTYLLQSQFNSWERKISVPLCKPSERCPFASICDASQMTQSPVTVQSVFVFDVKDRDEEAKYFVSVASCFLLQWYHHHPEAAIASSLQLLQLYYSLAERFSLKQLPFSQPLYIKNITTKLRIIIMLSRSYPHLLLQPKRRRGAAKTTT